MIGIGTSLLFGRRAGKAGPPIPPFNEAMVDAWFMSGPLIPTNLVVLLV